ncbi:hypothetical protein HZY86_07555 [Aerococcaceae bacterium DSM 111020]|nr:hypothetical protein [Aerococcaceae bacterium DSM 111020]
MRAFFLTLIFAFAINLSIPITITAQSKSDDIHQILSEMKKQDPKYDQLLPNGYRAYFIMDEQQNDSIQTVQMMHVPNSFVRDFEESQANLDLMQEKYLNDEHLNNEALYQYVSEQLPDTVRLDVYLAFNIPETNAGNLSSWCTSGSPLRVYQQGNLLSDSYDEYYQNLEPKEYFAYDYNRSSENKTPDYVTELVHQSNGFTLVVIPKELSEDEKNLLQQGFQDQINQYLGFKRFFQDDHYKELSN